VVAWGRGGRPVLETIQAQMFGEER